MVLSEDQKLQLLEFVKNNYEALFHKHTGVADSKKNAEKLWKDIAEN